MIAIETNYLTEYAKGFADGIANYNILGLDDLWHSYNQDIDINFTIDDFGLVHATAYEVTENETDGASINLF